LKFKKLKIKISELAKNSSDKKKTLKLMCDLLRSEIPYYDWVGFYFKNGKKKELKLSAFSGNPTDHTIIPFGKGICGQVALSNKNFVVPNVKKEKNYIPCNINVKSEIVVPILVNGMNVGQIDIDSNRLNPFTKEDEEFLEYVCGEISTFL
tara:strand:+ start:331 stop:783 length:453 start_codon:yes stop_codon:yes gene_type:complete